jgi:hypothetical protein
MARLGTTHAGLPVLLMSADPPGAFVGGADNATLLRHRFLQKPFAADEVARAVRAALGAAPYSSGEQRAAKGAPTDLLASSG